MKSKSVSLSSFLKLNTTTSLAHLISAIADSAVYISHTVGQGNLVEQLGRGVKTNIQGEEQKMLDEKANQVIIDTCSQVGELAGLASEEMEEAILLNPEGKYLLLFDPLDGSSNIDVNVSIGTIFSVLPAPHYTSNGKKKTTANQAEPLSQASFLQAGKNQLAAGYVVYGPQTCLVLTFGQGVVEFTLDRTDNTWHQTQAELKIAKKTQEYAINTSNQRHWYSPVQRYIDELNQGADGPRGVDFNMRWIASMVADVNRILHRGGIFMYPADRRDPKKPGRLRLMYEANPMSMLVEQAGGKSTNGHQRILQINPTALHERVAVFLGSYDEVTLVTKYHQSEPSTDETAALTLSKQPKKTKSKAITLKQAKSSPVGRRVGSFAEKQTKVASRKTTIQKNALDLTLLAQNSYNGLSI